MSLNSVYEKDKTRRYSTIRISSSGQRYEVTVMHYSVQDLNVFEVRIWEPVGRQFLIGQSFFSLKDNDLEKEQAMTEDMIDMLWKFVCKWQLEP